MLWADYLPFTDVHTVIRPSLPQKVIPNTTVEYRCEELDERNSNDIFPVTSASDCPLYISQRHNAGSIYGPYN